MSIQESQQPITLFSNFASFDIPQNHITPTPKTKDIGTLVEKILSNEKPAQLEGLVGLRKLLSLKNNPPIQEIVDSGVVPKVLEFLTWSAEPNFQFESAWAITNICSGTSQHVDYVVQQGGLDLIIPLLDSTLKEVLEQAVWALGNIAGDKVQYRDLCIQRNLMEKLTKILYKTQIQTDLQRNTVWAMSNLVRGKPTPDWDHIKLGIIAFSHVLKFPQFDEAIIDALWGISWSSEKYIQEVIDLGCVPSLIHYLESKEVAVLVPSLRALGNIVTGNDYQTNVCLSIPSFLPRVFDLTTHVKKNIRKESFWLISNVAAGTKSQIAMILSVPSYMERLRKGVTEDVPEVQIEASWAVGNLASGASHQQIAVLMTEYQYLDSVKAMLSSDNLKMKTIGLEASLNILNAGSQISEDNPYIQEFIDKGLVQKIKKCEDIEGEIGEKAKEILELFSDIEEIKSVESDADGKKKAEIQKKIQEKEAQEEEEEEDGFSEDDDDADEEEDDEEEKKEPAKKKEESEEKAEEYERED